jgi:hypothetical protein
VITLPESVKIGPHTYKIVFPYHFKERTDHFAQADHALFEIRITDVDQCGNIRPDVAILHTFFHELVHCIDEVYFYRCLFKDKDRERCVDILSAGMTQAFDEIKEISYGR